MEKQCFDNHYLTWRYSSMGRASRSISAEKAAILSEDKDNFKTWLKETNL